MRRIGAVATLGEPDRAEGYEPFFGLNEAPFSIAPDTRFLFASASFSAALSQLGHSLDRREPLVVVTGEIGTGKTLLCRAMLQQLRRKTFLSVVNDPFLERDDLLKQLLQDFGVIGKDRAKLTDTTRHDLIEALHAFLRSLRAITAHAVVIIDEAQHLQPDVLEQIRLLSNIDDERGTLLQIILVGQPELESLLSRPDLRQLQQRVSRRLRLEPLTREEVNKYIDHRLGLARAGTASRVPGAAELTAALAEWSGTNAAVEFTPDAVHALSELSGGLPRLINLLCDRSLEEACALRLRVIDVPLVQKAARALGVTQQAAPSPRPIQSATGRRTDAKPEESFWSLTGFESATPHKTVQPVAATAVVASDADGLPEASPRRQVHLPLLPLAGVLVLGAAAAAWFGIRAAYPPLAPLRSSTGAPASSASIPSSARPDPTPSRGNTRRPDAPAPVETPAPPPSAAKAPAAATSAPAGGELFEIIVASFRTESRAASVAGDVTALGLPIRRRAVDGWQQVICGPFQARTTAEEAQQRLLRAGLGSTQIVRATR
jgi:general secretion pathway protein A